MNVTPATIGATPAGKAIRRTPADRTVGVTPGNRTIGSRAAWWLHPSAIAFAFLLPVYLLIWFTGELTSGTLSTSKAFFFLHGPIAWLGVVTILVLGLGTLSPIRPTNADTAAIRLNLLAVTAIGVLALLGYAYWFKDFIIRPGSLLAAIRESASFSYAIRRNLERSAGIASLAQLGLPYLMACGYLMWAGVQRITGLQRLMFWLIVLAIAFRSFAWAERLALLEALVALCLVWVAYRAPTTRPVVSRMIPFMPFIGGVVVVGLFAVGEYFRSWSAYYHKLHDSFGEFIAQRLVNYYYNALNTGAGQLTMFQWPTFDFEFTLNWLYKVPIAGAIFGFLTGAKRGDYLEFLYRYGDPEFNNPSGLFTIYFDMGIPLGLALFFLIGVLAKFFYVYWRAAAGFTGAVYLLFVMTFLELFRYFYLGSSRCFVVTMGLLILLVTARGIERVRT